MAAFVSPHIPRTHHQRPSFHSNTLCISLLLLFPSALCDHTTAAPISSPSLSTAAVLSTTHKLLIALNSSALLLTCLLLMAYFSCFRFKLVRKKVQSEEEGAEHDRQCAGTTVKAAEELKRSHLCGESDEKKSVSVRRFGWEDVEKLSMNFSCVIGEGGFSKVYLARFSDSSLGAVKIHCSSERLSRVFKQELQVLMQVRHENIVKFLGYCDEREEGALVLEYIPRGTLHEKLHNRNYQNEGDQGHDDHHLLTWDQRMLVAFQLARAIEYLHDGCDLQIIHCDIKASNILLDDHLNCKLCDFGSAKMGFSSTVVPSSINAVTGSPGYVDPHYMRTGIVSKKTDVYSFGVLVLELITGIEAFCEERQQLLTSIVGPTLKDPAKIVEVIDPRLVADHHQFDRIEEAVSVVTIASLCLCDQPSLRPSMAEIVPTLKEKISAIHFLCR